MNLADSEHILRAGTMVVDARDSIDACDLKTTRNNALFSSPVAAGRSASDELRVISKVGAGWKRTSLRVVEIVWTRDMASECSGMLGEMTFEDFCVEDDEFSMFE